jgi:hypothetical protein
MIVSFAFFVVAQKSNQKMLEFDRSTRGGRSDVLLIGIVVRDIASLFSERLHNWKIPILIPDAVILMRPRAV